MKQKKLGKKLHLNKKTVARLNRPQMNAVRGRGETCPGICFIFITQGNPCSEPNTNTCNCTDGCGTAQSECVSLDQIFCTTYPEVTCCD